MTNITHEQFEYWCQYWGYTTEEGYKAMCFVANIIGQQYGNCIDKEKEIHNNPYSSEAFKGIVDVLMGEARILFTLYGKLDNAVFTMLESTNGGKANGKQ